MSPRSKWPAVWAVALALALAGCGQEDDAVRPSISPPACKSVTSFGNGAVCSAKEPALVACGTSKQRTCASGWLCFHAPERVDCACAADADCQERAAYINAARVTAKKAPMAAKCQGGRCAGQP